MKLYEIFDFRSSKKIWSNPSFLQLQGISNTVGKTNTTFRGVANKDNVCIGSADDWIHPDLVRQSGIEGVNFYVFIPHKDYGGDAGQEDAGQVVTLSKKSMNTLLQNPTIQGWIQKGMGYDVSIDKEEKNWLQTTGV